jgi:hypothetical protein
MNLTERTPKTVMTKIPNKLTIINAFILPPPFIDISWKNGQIYLYLFHPFFFMFSIF